MDDIFVYVIDLPDKINEMVLPCVDGYTIYIDAGLSYDAQIRAYHHALCHIERNDFEKFDVQEIELNT